MGGKIRGIGALTAMFGLATAVVGVPAHAVVPGVVDLAVDIESQPTTVSPPGELALFEVVVSNVGAVPTASEVTVDLPDGAAYRDDLSFDGCAASGADAVCAVPSVAPGQEQSIDVVAHTPGVAGTYTTSATVAATGLVEPLEHTANNSDSTTTEVLAPNPGVTAGLVEEGDSLSLDVGDGRRYVLTVPEGVPGVIVERLAAQSGTGKSCGDAGCGDGFILKFVEGHPTYKALDPLNPLRADITFGAQDPCRGLGGGCADIYWAPDAEETELARMENCPGSDASTAGDGTARPNPCVNQRYKVSNVIQFDVRLLSNDPLTVPPLLTK